MRYLLILAMAMCGCAGRPAAPMSYGQAIATLGAAMAQNDYAPSPYSGSAMTIRTPVNDFTTFSGGGSAMTTHTGISDFTTFSNGGSAMTTHVGNTSFTTYSGF